MNKKFNINIKQSDESFSCYANENLLKGMARLGRKGIPVGCRSGGCGVCKIKIINGLYEAGPMSREHISVDEERDDIALACRVFPGSDIDLLVLGEMKHGLVSNPPVWHQKSSVK